MPKIVERSDAAASATPMKKPKLRSPNYPVVGLERAVELAALLHKQYGSHPVPVTLIHKLWKFAEGSNTGNQCISALRSYGLVDVTGELLHRKAAMSKVGVRIVGNAPDRPSLLKTAALGPVIHKEILEHFGEAGLPADDLLERYLVWDRPEGQRFNPGSVKEFIERFRGTLAYSGALPADIIDSGDGHESDAEGGQCEVKLDPPPADKTQRKRRIVSTGMKEDVFTLEEGDVVLQWPEAMTAESATDLEDWFSLVMRKIKRSIAAPTHRVSDTAEDDEGNENSPLRDM